MIIRLPIPTAKPLLGFGQRSTAVTRTSSTANLAVQRQQQQQAEEPAPLMLPGPAALQALLHELGHALSYLCPAANLHAHGAEAAHLVNNSSSSSTDGVAAEPAAAADAAAGACAPLGPAGSCLLAGPAAGLDVRELSSHLMEHYARHPAALMVRRWHDL